MKQLVYYFTLLSSIVSFLITVVCSNDIAIEFYLVILYPLIYGFFFMLLWPGLCRRETNGRVTIGIFLVLQWLRLVSLPALGALSGYFKSTGQLINEQSAQSASLLMLFEAVVTFLVAYLILWKKPKHQEVHVSSQGKNWEGLSGNAWVYIVFVFVAALLFISTGADRYTFFALDLSGEDRVSLDNSSNVMAAIIDYGLSVLVILLTNYAFKKYKSTGKKRYMTMSLLVALVRICIIDANSDGRLAVLYPIGAFLLLLPDLYPKYKRTIVRNVVLVGGFVLALMTVYKVFYAFFYDSYIDALQNSAADFDVHDTAKQIDIYFYGVRMVAQNLYVSERIDLDITTLLTDYLRNTFGIHYLFGDALNTTIAKYNLYIYGGEYATGHLFSSLAYGASYLTGVLAPLMTVINILICTGFEKWLQRLRHIDSFYIVSIVYVRLVYNMFSCFPMAWNYASRTLLLGAFVIGGASFFRIRASRTAQGRDVNL